MSTVAVDLVFAALADATRRQLLERLATQGAASASTIADELPITRQAIAKHLTVFEQAGLVSRERRGKAICFAAEPHQLAATGRWLQRMAGRWDVEQADDGRSEAPGLTPELRDHAAQIDEMRHAV